MKVSRSYTTYSLGLKVTAGLISDNRHRSSQRPSLWVLAVTQHHFSQMKHGSEVRYDTIDYDPKQKEDYCSLDKKLDQLC